MPPERHHETRHENELQRQTDAYFGRSAVYWRDVYGQESLQGRIYRERMQAALGWVDDLRLPPGAKVLEVGCGAGLATIELARRGFSVKSTDSSADMVALASDRVAAAGLGDNVAFAVADAHALPLGSDTFSLVFALGVLPWLHSPQRALQEMARVLVPEGHAVVTADNRLRLNLRLKAPLLMAIKSRPLVPLKMAWRAWRRRAPAGTGGVQQLHTPTQVDRMLLSAGLRPVRRTSVGFGPFALLERSGLEPLGLRLHRGLESLARHIARLRCAGWHYLVCARRPPAHGHDPEVRAARGSGH